MTLPFWFQLLGISFPTCRSAGVCMTILSLYFQSFLALTFYMFFVKLMFWLMVVFILLVFLDIFCLELVHLLWKLRVAFPFVIFEVWIKVAIFEKKKRKKKRWFQELSKRIFPWVSIKKCLIFHYEMSLFPFSNLACVRSNSTTRLISNIIFIIYLKYLEALSISSTYHVCSFLT